MGHKTASVVMAQAFGVPAFPVDTHIHRLAARWGLSDGSSVVRTEDDLKRLYAPEHWNPLHLQIIYFGREHCPALRHDQGMCPICSWAAPRGTPRAAHGDRRHGPPPEKQPGDSPRASKPRPGRPARPSPGRRPQARANARTKRPQSRRAKARLRARAEAAIPAHHLEHGADMGTLSDSLSDPAKRKQVIEEAQRTVDAEVSDKSGLSGMAIKAAYSMAKGVAPGIMHQDPRRARARVSRRAAALLRRVQTKGRRSAGHAAKTAAPKPPTRCSPSPTSAPRPSPAACSRAATASSARAPRSTWKPPFRAWPT